MSAFDPLVRSILSKPELPEEFFYKFTNWVFLLTGKCLTSKYVYHNHSPPEGRKF